MVPGAKMPKKDISGIFDESTDESPIENENTKSSNEGSSIFDDFDDITTTSKSKVKSIFDDDGFTETKPTKSKVSSIFDDDDSSDVTFSKPSNNESITFEKTMKPLDDPNLTRAKQSGRRPPSRLRKK